MFYFILLFYLTKRLKLVRLVDPIKMERWKAPMPVMLVNKLLMGLPLMCAVSTGQHLTLTNKRSTKKDPTKYTKNHAIGNTI